MKKKIKTKKIHTKKTRESRGSYGGEIIFGLHAVAETLQAKNRTVLTIFTTQPEPKQWRSMIAPLLTPTIKITYSSRDELTKRAGTSDHQSIVATTTQRTLRNKCFAPDRAPFLVMVDRIQDPRNLGAIARSAYCVGADGIIIPQKGNAPITGTVIKSSAGLIEHLEIWQPTTAYAAAQELVEQGYNLYAAALGGNNALEQAYKKPLVVVIGNEAMGISRELLRLSHAVMLAQRTPNISYNASVAAGILLFTIAHKIGVLK